MKRASERQREAFGRRQRDGQRGGRREKSSWEKDPRLLVSAPAGGGGDRVPAQQASAPTGSASLRAAPRSPESGGWAFLRLLPMSGPGRPVSSECLPMLLA